MDILLLSIALLSQTPAPAPQGEAASPPLVSAQPQATQNYVVGPRDVLRINVFDELTLTGPYSVDAGGFINFPLVGRVRVGGVTVREIEDELRKVLAERFLVNPQVTVEVAEFRSQQVFIMGEVRAPGRYTLEGNTSLLEALAIAGSVTQDAGDDVLVVHPKTPTGTRAALPQDADAEVATVSLRDLQTGRLSQVEIRDGDTILVTRADTIFLTGQVRSPGSYTMERGMTVLQALSLAGGLTDRGSQRGIKIQRIVDGEKNRGRRGRRRPRAAR